MKKYISKIALSVAAGALALASATSCSSDLDLEPNGYYTYSTFWQTSDQYKQFIPAQMQMFRNSFPAQIFFSAGELRAGTLWLAMLDGSGNANPQYVQNLYDTNNTQYSSFGGWWGFIANWNELIMNAESQEGVLDDNTRDGLLAMAYGMRAFSFFQMYRMYGGLPLRLTPDVTVGITNPNELFLARSTAEETLAQIKKDVAKSIELFGKTTYAPSSKKYYYWNVNASKVLAAQVYLWSGKVETGDHKANPADVAVAKDYYLDVLNNGGYSLLPNYFNNWLVPGNSETIFSINYTSMDDKVFQAIGTSNFLWSRTTGAATGLYWSNIGESFDEKLPANQVNRFGYKADYSTKTTLWNKTSFGVQRYQYKNALYFQFQDGDQRKDAWYPCWYVKDEENNPGKDPSGKDLPPVKSLDNFDYRDYDMAGTFTIKYRPTAAEGYTYWQFMNDMAVYRLADVYLGLAECYNYEGNNAEMAKYLNALRKRAYGANWDETQHAYVPGSFKDNEVAILHEADKEYFMEGRRWWDLRRLTTVKNGAQTDHLVFQPEGCVGWGLDVANSPWMKEMDYTPCVTNEPVMPTSWEYRLLWPIDLNTLGADPLLNDDGKGQNPGY